MNALWSGLGLGIGGLLLYLLGTLNGTLIARGEQREERNRAQLLPLAKVDTAGWWSSDGDEEILTHDRRAARAIPRGEAGGAHPRTGRRRAPADR